MATPSGGSRALRTRVAALAAIVALGEILADAALPTRSAEASARPDRGIHGRAHRPPAASREIYGYLPYWELDRGTAARIDYRLVTTIAFFAVPVRASGSLNRASSGYRAYVGRDARAVTNAAHARGVRVVPTFQLFDRGRLATLRGFLGSRAAQARFIREALALIARRAADGANIDFEPVPRSLTRPFVAFVGRFGKAMHARFPRSQLVVATPALASRDLIRRLGPRVDRIFVMAYDYHRSASRTPGPVAPLWRASLTVTDTIQRYLEEVPAAKVILGVPFYGYSWPVERRGRTVRVRSPAARWGGVHGVTYGGVLHWLADHPSVRVHREAGGGAWFRYWDRAHRTLREVHFETAGLAQAKFNVAIARGLAGVGIWALGSDRGVSGMRRALSAVYLHPVRAVSVGVAVGRPRLVRGIIRVATTIRVADRGNRAERGLLAWRVVGPSGRTVAHGQRVVAVYPRASVRVRMSLGLGAAWQRRAGRYHLIVTFRSDGSTWRAPARSFWQPY